MAGRKQETHAKRARELALRERRERKRAKKAEAAAQRAQGVSPSSTPEGGTASAEGQAETGPEWIR